MSPPAFSEWKERNDSLLRRMREYKEAYHFSVCENADEKHKKRGCYRVDKIRYCRSAKLAVARKFKKEIDQQISELLALGLGNDSAICQSPEESVPIIKNTPKHEEGLWILLLLIS